MGTRGLGAAVLWLLLGLGFACGGGDDEAGGPGGPGGGGSDKTSADFQKLSDFTNDDTVVAAVNDSGFAGVCVGSGAPDITGKYRPFMRVADCGGCESSIGNENDPSQVLWYCNQSGDSVQSWTTATAAAGEGSQTFLGTCPSWPSAGPDEVAFTIYGATDGQVEGCSLTTVNLATYIYNTRFGTASWGEALDVIIRIGDGCAALGVTTQPGDWFLWQPSKEGFSPLARLGNCQGDAVPRPLFCGQASNQPCTASQCATDNTCISTTSGNFCLPNACSTCAANSQSCLVPLDCSEAVCQ